ncbi:MAG: DNA repair protein RecO [Rhodospirillaceae bacterium]|jgi:DNA repair protein RecO (recombination protein O)|nr:DNA repair protein RecO [Rhodospirillaceae bacterium]MBT6089386.1 DNA repair protein RecO [Rhodospirillaceae bacterium]
MAVEWTDLGLVLSVRKLGEHDIILHALTEQHGHHAGVVKGGGGRRARGLYQPGNKLHVRWRARLEDHLGTFVCEPDRMYAAGALHDRMMLTSVTALCATAEAVLPEREVHSLAYQQACHLLETLGESSWVIDYVLWEMHLLNELGFGLDLSSCASTGVTEDLIYVSPKSGRAVSRAAGVPYKGQLRALPSFLIDEQPELPSTDDVIAGLDLTGFFLERHVYAPHQKTLPDARQRLRALVVK